MSKYSIWIAQPRGWLHSKLFIEVARGLAYSLRQLGHDVDFNPGDGETIMNPKSTDSRPIIFAPHFLIDCPLRQDAILYNFEQTPGDLGNPGELAAQMSDAWLRHDALKMFRRHETWDYSATNIERLRRMGVENVHHCRVGFSPNLQEINSVGNEDIDVLFFGTVQEGSRRHMLYKQLEGISIADEITGQERPLRVQFLSGVYGAERNQAIARAKVVLNVHINEPKVMPGIFEIVRCSYLFMNKKCVVSEDGSSDPELEALANKTTMCVPFEKIPEAVVTLIDEKLGGKKLRNLVAQTGFDVFSKIKQVDEVERVLKEIK